ncbi:MAG TPA: 50S ribosomal protein L32 [Candidatus Paceibacterota bacterium]|nr:50S ribosomal protein L32 [Candidatus Paceibacterota bacterium]
MSVRMRHTSSHTKNRRSHHALVEGAIVKDKESGNLRLPHRIDEATGMYRGKLIVPERKKEIKTEKKRRERNQQKDELATVAGAKEPVHAEKVTVEEREKKQGLLGRMTKGKAKARSGMGGGA